MNPAETVGEVLVLREGEMFGEVVVDEGVVVRGGEEAVGLGDRGV